MEECFMKKIAFFVALTLCLVPALFAEEGGIVSSSEVFLQITSVPEAKIGFTQSFEIPFLQGDNPLTEENNVTFAFTAELTPISVNLLADAVWTPVAVFELALGGRIGTGWQIASDQGLNGLYGIGLNQRRPIGTNNDRFVADGSAFDGLMWKTYLGGALQFDLAAVMPGEWNHIVFKTYHEINYQAYTRAGDGQSWFFENDEGENRNGFSYYGNFFLGYKMPIILDLVGLLAEMDLYLYDTPGRARWGDDRIRWTFGCLFNFAITEQLGATLIVQGSTARNFTNYNENGNRYRFYQDRILDTNNPLRLEFYRVAATVTYKL
jgi:hypothetical protein